MKGGSILLGYLYPLPLRKLPEGIHDVGNIDIIGASGRTGLAGSADPYGVAADCLVQQSHLEHAHQPVRRHIHGEGHRAAIGALLTLKAGSYLLPAQILDFPSQ
jgi:hypothetical protein